MDPSKVENLPSLLEGDVAMKERLKRDVPLLALKMKEGNTSQGMWEDFRRCKK